MSNNAHYVRLYKNRKIRRNSLTNKDKRRFFSVYKLRTKYFFRYLNLFYIFYANIIISICR